MKKVFQQLRMLRNLAMLLMLMLCANVSAFALESDDINAKILNPSSTVIPKWAANNWEFAADSTFITNPSFDSTLTTTLSMTFSSQYAMLFSVQRYVDIYGTVVFDIVIDGETQQTPSLTDRKWTTFEKSLIAGEHKIEFVVNLNDATAFCAIKNVIINTFRPLETECVSDKSLPLTFDDDSDHPWLTYDGYIQSKNDNSNTSSSISTTFTIDIPSLFSYKLANGGSNYNSSYSWTKVYINGNIYEEIENGYWTSGSVVLYPGTYTIEFENFHSTEHRSSYFTQIKEVCLRQDWLEANLSHPGELGTRIMQALGDGNIQDVELVKITGSLNSEDWTTVSKLENIKGIDFTGTDITSIPEKAFYNKSQLSTVIMPESLIEIGNEAFVGTIFYETTIPSSVEVIGNQVWESTRLTYLHFAPDSHLKKIGYYAFSKTNLCELIMPDSVTEYSLKRGNYNSDKGEYFYYWSIVSGCQKLRNLHISNNLDLVPDNIAGGCISLEEVNIPIRATSIEDQAFYNTPSLKTIEIPETVKSIGLYVFKKSGLESIVLPDSLKSVGMEAFCNTNLEAITIPKNVSSYGSYIFKDCTKLKSVVLNSHCRNMDYTFQGCTALETVVLPCATPPSISNDPFSGVNKANVKLIVPDFALFSYGLDNYWLNFTKRQSGDEASISDYWAIRGNLVLDKDHKMQGTPSIDMFTSSTLTMDTDITQSFNEFEYSTQESYPCAYLSKSNSVTANKLTTRFYVETANKWFFFSPVCDVKMSDISYPSTDSWVIRYYDGARRATQNASSGNWVNVPADGTLRRGQGYIIQANKTGWLYMPVAAENHSQFFGANEVTMPLADNPCETEANAGWNFVANPYPCYYDIYHINMQAPITVWNGSTYRAFSLNDGDRGDDTFVLRPMQPFFVQKTAANISAGMPLVGRQVNTVIDRTRAPRRESQGVNPLRNLLNLELTKMDGTEADDYTRIVINEEASLEYERTGDASKFMSMDDQVAQFFSLGENNTPLAINERPYDNGIVNLGVYMPKSGETYTISATRSDRQAWLYDAETGIEQDLTLGDYMFTSSKSGFDCNRFSIRFSPVTNAVDKVSEVLTKVNAGKGVLAITAADEAKVAVYAADGSVIAATTGSTEIEVPAGIYLVKVGDKTFKTIVK